jgi:hypothetical protein
MPPSPKLKLVSTGPQKQTHTRVDTLEVSPAKLKSWKSPPFQRPLRVNAKVEALAEQIKLDGGVIPGVLTIGLLGKEEYLLDGQHRREAFYISGLQEGYVDVRFREFEDMAGMGEEFVNLNSALVRLRPDDILRGLEGTNEALTTIRKKCPFVGYDMIRRSEKSPIIGMSILLRCWVGSAPETPTSSGSSAAQIARTFTTEDAIKCVEFLSLAEQAWGRDPEYARLWGSLNLALCMWLFRRLVLADNRKSGARTVTLTKEQFRACLASLSAEPNYLEYLVGRQLSERDRSPAYDRIKTIFVRRLHHDTGKRAILPAPPWTTHQSASRYR